MTARPEDEHGRPRRVQQTRRTSTDLRQRVIRTSANPQACCTLGERHPGGLCTAVVLQWVWTTTDVGERSQARDLHRRTLVDIHGCIAEGYGSRGWRVGSVAKCVAQPADISGRRRTDAESAPRPCRLCGRPRTPADELYRLCKAEVQPRGRRTPR